MYYLYKLSFANTDKVYIGYSVNPEGRLSSHKKMLKNGNHDNALIQEYFYEHGDFPELEILAEIEDKKEAMQQEHDLIDSLQQKNKSLNIYTGYKWTDEHRKAQSKRMSGYKMSDATKEKIRQNNLNMPQETRDKISRTLKGRKIPREVVEKISAANKGKKRSEGFREKCRQKGLNTPQEVRDRISARMKEIWAERRALKALNK